MTDDRRSQFENMLDEHHVWPCPYVFKFIVPTDNLPLLAALFESERLETRESRGGKFTSVTLESTMCSGREVMEVYRRASEIPGLMAL
ncbi:DUF493 family protein [Pseudodesulfovibrio sp. F-1]|uniref:DUF493 family protein n=1 Tax=Pseudodesulfovibrio alkaliphilus TaxID=2661613 RepID=A0A7K1KRF2_9BACT|nr:DUF493 family protein [Pseudodesulfovibrio alkaliphilus]MUM78441.1 DUF493 family protein [Pseudodesulfovibrio alkaliphilus]